MRLKFYLRAAAYVIGCNLLASGVYSAMMLLMSENTTPLDALSMLPLYIMVYGGFMQMGFGAAQLKSTANLALSMGATRRSVFLGLIVVTGLPTLGNAVLIAATAALVSALGAEPVFSLEYMVPLGIAVCLSLSGAGLLIAIIQRRFGSVIAVIAGILIFLLAFGVVFSAGLGLFDAWNFGALLEEISWWIFSLAGFLFYGIVLIPLHRTVYRFAVTM